MNLRWQELETRVRRRIEAEFGASEPSFEEYHQLRSQGRQHSPVRTRAGRALMAGVAGLVVAGFAQSAEATGALILLWTLAVLLARADGLVWELYLSPRLHVFNHLPMADEVIFRVQSQSFLRHSLWSVVDFSILYTILLFQLGGFTLAAALVLGLIHWLGLTAVAVALHRLAPGRHFSRLSTFFILVAAVLLFFQTGQLRMANWINDFAAWIPPVGWIQYALGISTQAGPAAGLLPTVMLAAVLGLAPVIYRRARQGYLLREAIFSLARRTSGTTNPGEPVRPGLAEEFARLPEEVEAKVRTRAFLAGMANQRAGWIERAVFFWLNPRERALAEFAQAARPPWTGHFWKFILLFVGIMIGVRFFLPSLGKDYELMVLTVMLLPGANQWPAFASARGIVGIQSPPYIFYPAGYWELARMVLKVGLVHLVARQIFVLALLATMVGVSAFQGGLTGSPALKLVVISLMVQPLLVLVQFSPGTNDTHNPAVMLATAALVIVLAISGVTVFASTHSALVACAAVMGALCSTLALVVYGRFFARGAFDIVPANKA